MPKKLHRSLRVHLSKLKKIKTLSLPNTPRTNSLLSACKYPKTPSFSVGRHAVAPAANRDMVAAATLSDVDRFLFENFHSLCLHNDDDSSDNDDSADHRSRNPRDAIKPSDRFFVSPGASNSLVDEARTTGGTSSSSSSSSSRPRPPDHDTAAVLPGDSVAVMTFSKDPYDDFRRSMQDMVASRHVAAAAAAGQQQQQPLDWDFMEELLFCYLELNDRSVHKYVLKAFTDLTVSFRRRGAAPAVSARGRRRRKVVAPAAEEKGKDCYYHEKRNHMGET